MKKVYGYLRVSTAKQGEGVSLIEQKDAIVRYAAQYNLSIIQWFEEKETAAKQGRPLFTAMMKMLQAKKVDGVIIHKIDRGARNLKDWSDLGTLIDQGIEVHFAHESLDLQARGGRLSADIQAVIAADYIRNLRQEAIKGLYGRLKQGIYPFKAPVGYLNMGKGKYKVIDPVQGTLVKKAFELYSTKKYTIKTLTSYMNELGLRNVNSKQLTFNGLSHMLNNPFYVGILKVKGITFNGGHEPLISQELFKRVQAILRGSTNQKVLKHNLQFRRLLLCNLCGYSLTGEIQKGHVYYRCHAKACTEKGIRETTIENYLFKAFEAVKLHPEEIFTLDSLLKETELQWDTKRQKLLAVIKMETVKTQEKLERLTDCYIEAGLDKETYEKRKEKLLMELKEKEASEKKILFEKTGIIKKARRFFELSKDLKKSYEIGVLEERRDLVEITTSNLKVESKRLMIEMRLPFLDLWQRPFLMFGEHTHDALRKESSILVYSDINTSPITGEPLSKDKLKLLLDLILEHISQLPEINDEP